MEARIIVTRKADLKVEFNLIVFDYFSPRYSYYMRTLFFLENNEKRTNNLLIFLGFAKEMEAMQISSPDPDTKKKRSKKRDSSDAKDNDEIYDFGNFPSLLSLLKKLLMMIYLK